MKAVAVNGNYPHKDEPFAYIVFNPKEVGIEFTEQNEAYRPHSGDQFLAAVAGQGQNDDWFISTELSGEEQTISLFARSYSVTYGKEQFEILYSTTDKETASFKAPEGTYKFEASDEWTEYNVSLPKDAKYFAIHYTSPYIWMLMIDDVSYTAKSREVTAYRLYRDKEYLADVPADTRNFVDKGVTTGIHVYNVSALYDGNESKLSAEAQVNLGSGVEEISIDGGSEVTVYDMQGITVAKGRVDDIKKTLPAGIYVIRQGGSAVKLILK